MGARRSPPPPPKRSPLESDASQGVTAAAVCDPEMAHADCRCAAEPRRSRARCVWRACAQAQAPALRGVRAKSAPRAWSPRDLHGARGARSTNCCGQRSAPRCRREPRARRGDERRAIAAIAAGRASIRASATKPGSSARSRQSSTRSTLAEIARGHRTVARSLLADPQWYAGASSTALGCLGQARRLLTLQPLWDSAGPPRTFSAADRRLQGGAAEMKSLGSCGRYAVSISVAGNIARWVRRIAAVDRRAGSWLRQPDTNRSH